MNELPAYQSSVPTKVCPRCEGTGKLLDRNCPECKGVGVIPIDQEVVMPTRRATVGDLKPGDVFDWIDGSWHGRSEVREMEIQQEPTEWSQGRARLVFDNHRIVNPPGLWYGNPDHPVDVFETEKGPEPMTPAEHLCEIEPNQRGFLTWEATMTADRSLVSIAESSSAEGPHLWLRTTQPTWAGRVRTGSAKTSAHLTLDQAEELESKLGLAIATLRLRLAGEDLSEHSLRWEPTSTDYGAVITISEASKDGKDYLCLNTEQPPPAHDGALAETRASARLDLGHAEEIHAKLGQAIAEVRRRWGSESERDTFTVFAVYAETHQRFATTVEAENSQDAEQLAEQAAEGDLIIAAVVEGEVDAVDQDPYLAGILEAAAG